MTSKETFDEVLAVTNRMISLGLCNEQNYPKIEKVGRDTEITIAGKLNLSASLRNVEYREIYDALSISRSYNIMMLDGGLVQMLYTFTGRTLRSHHLAYFPSPDFEAFQNDEELYLTDEIYADILQKSILPCPVRFDFDESDKLHEEIFHPKSHLTLGQYTNCRIPVSAALTPCEFAGFVLRSFYGSAYRKFNGTLWPNSHRFDEILTSAEQSILHVRLCHPKYSRLDTAG